MSADLAPHRLTAAEASARIAAGTLSVEALARYCLAHIADREPAIRAWSWLDPDKVLRDARELDKTPRIGPLHGIPIGVKDVFDTADMPTQHNSPHYRGHTPRHNGIGCSRAAGFRLRQRAG